MGPFLRANNKANKMMLNVLIALTPIILFSIYKNGYIPYSQGLTSLLSVIYPLLFILIGATTSTIIETVYSLIFKKSIKNNYSFFPGLFLSLILPLNTPILVLIMGASVATIIGKLVFGGFGKNIFNPALIGYIFVIAIFSTGTYLNAFELDTLSSATPLTNSALFSGIGTYEQLIKPYGSLLNFFVGTIPGSLGETSSLLCIVAFIYLFLTKTIKWKIPVIYVLTVFTIDFIVSRLLGIGIYYPLFKLLSGGLLFGSIFMATDPVTSPVTNVGQILYGTFLGIITSILRFTGIEGVATSILIMNMFVFILDKIGAKAKFNISKIVIPITISVILIFLVGFFIASQKHTKNGDPNFKIESKNKNNNEINYIASQKGYGGSIKASIKIVDNKITEINVISHHETLDRYQLIIDNDYINKLIVNQNNLNELDTISSATVTASSFKKLITNVLENNK